MGEIIISLGKQAMCAETFPTPEAHTLPQSGLTALQQMMNSGVQRAKHLLSSAVALLAREIPLLKSQP